MLDFGVRRYIYIYSYIYIPGSLWWHLSWLEHTRNLESHYKRTHGFSVFFQKSIYVLRYLYCNCNLGYICIDYHNTQGAAGYVAWESHQGLLCAMNIRQYWSQRDIGKNQLVSNKVHDAHWEHFFLTKNPKRIRGVTCASKKFSLVLPFSAWRVHDAR